MRVALSLPDRSQGQIPISSRKNPRFTCKPPDFGIIALQTLLIALTCSLLYQHSEIERPTITNAQIFTAERLPLSLTIPKKVLTIGPDKDQLKKESQEGNRSAKTGADWKVEFTVKEAKSCLEKLGMLKNVVHSSAEEAQIDPRLLLSMMHVESQCRSSARSSRGAVGFLQILPSTAKAVGVTEPDLPSENIRAGARYVKLLQEMFGSDLRMVLAAYNAGPAAVQRYKGIPPYRETEQFVGRVMSLYAMLIAEEQSPGSA